MTLPTMRECEEECYWCVVDGVPTGTQERFGKPERTCTACKGRKVICKTCGNTRLHTIDCPKTSGWGRGVECTCYGYACPDCGSPLDPLATEPPADWKVRR